MVFLDPLVQPGFPIFRSVWWTMRTEWIERLSNRPLWIIMIINYGQSMESMMGEMAPVSTRYPGVLGQDHMIQHPKKIFAEIFEIQNSTISRNQVWVQSKRIWDLAQNDAGIWDLSSWPKKPFWTAWNRFNLGKQTQGQENSRDQRSCVSDFFDRSWPHIIYISSSLKWIYIKR